MIHIQYLQMTLRTLLALQHSGKLTLEWSYTPNAGLLLQFVQDTHAPTFSLLIPADQLDAAVASLDALNTWK